MKLLLVGLVGPQGSDRGLGLALKAGAGMAMVLGLWPAAHVPVWVSLSGGVSNLNWFLVAMGMGVVFICAGVPSPSASPYGLAGGVGLVSILFFCADGVIKFYVFFEMSLVPIVLLIMGQGYQPERVAASFSLLFYTISASMPLMGAILFFSKSGGLSSLAMLGAYAPGSSASAGVSCAMLVAFMVKIPLFGVHLWLPKAHVEAPVVGSILLAAILLKLGGYGVVAVSPLVAGSVNHSLGLFSVCGGGWTSFICLRQTDMKVMIAYSSVSHMSLMVSCVLGGSYWCVFSGTFIMLSHSFSSAWMFFFSAFFYSRSYSRNLLLGGGLGAQVWGLTLAWFMGCVGNLGGPPMITLWAELSGIVGMVGISWSFGLPLSFTIFLGAGYSLVLFSALGHGKGGGLPKMGSAPHSREEAGTTGMLGTILIAGVFFLDLVA